MQQAKSGLFSRLFGKKEEKQEEIRDEELAEVPEFHEPDARISIQIDRLDSYAACDRILRKIKANSIVIAKIKELRDSNMDELKQSISRLKTSVFSWDGDIAGVGGEWLIITPRHAKIQRKEEAE